MKRIAYSFGLVLSVLLLTSCPSLVELPVCPAAYAVPTVMPLSAVSQCSPCREVTVAAVRHVLSESRQIDFLSKAGFQDSEMDILARGLRRSGYAEIDARRSNAPLRWIALAGMDGGAAVQVSSAYGELPPKDVWPDENAVLRQMFNEDGTPGMFIVQKVVKINEVIKE